MTNSAESWIAVGSLAVAAASFTWGVVQYIRGERQKREQLRAERKREAIQRRIEASRPFLEKQLEFYLDATLVAAIIAVSKDDAAVAAATERFNELFWGKLALVEDKGVEQGMIAFKEAVEKGGDREQASLDLAHACRNSLAKSWGTPVWKSHYRKVATQKKAP
jgi:hypothetical protein